MPVGCERLEAAARAENPDARLWRGDLQMEPSQRGIVILRGHSRVRLVTVGAEGGRTRNVSPTDPRVDGPPMCLVAPLVLRRCSDEFLSAHRQPALSHSFATRRSWHRCSLSFSDHGIVAAGNWRFGAPQCNETQIRPHWASWADTIKMRWNERHPEVAEGIIQAIHDRDEAPSIHQSSQFGGG